MKLNKITLKFITLIVFVLFSVSLIFFASFLSYNQETIAAKLTESYTPWIIFLVLVTLASATTLPITAVAIPAVFLFPFWWTLIFGFFGIMIGAFIVYFTSRYLGRSFVKEYVEKRGGKVKAINEVIESNSLEILLLLNCVYIFPSNLAHMTAAVTETKFWKFWAAMIIGNFTNYFSLLLLFYGVFWYNFNYISIAVILLVSVNFIPLSLYSKHLKTVWALAFGKESYQKFKKVKNELKEELKKLD